MKAKRFLVIVASVMCLAVFAGCDMNIDEDDLPLYSIGLYTNTGSSWFLYEGVISGKDVSISIPQTYKTATFYLVGLANQKATMSWDGVQKNMAAFDKLNANDDYAVSLYGKNSHKLKITATVLKNNSNITFITTYTVSVTWTPSIIYNLNGGAGTIPVDAAAYEEGDGITIKGIGDAYKDTTGGRTYAKFLGWNYGGRLYQPGDKITMEPTDITLTAKWTQYGIGEKITHAYDIFGNSLQGGYVAYIWTDKDASYISSATNTKYNIVNAGGQEWRYLVVCSTSLNKVAWCNEEDSTISVLDTSMDIGAGKDNYDKINSTLEASLAKTVYDFYKMYLPSAGEMEVVYKNLGAKAVDTGYLASYYWTSTQCQDTEKAYCFNAGEYYGGWKMYEANKKNTATIYSDWITIAVSYLPAED